MFCWLAAKRRSLVFSSQFLTWKYIVYMYKMYFILNRMGFRLFLFRPPYAFYVIFNSLFCGMPLCCTHDSFILSFLSFLSLAHSNQPTFGYHLFCMCVCVRACAGAFEFGGNQYPLICIGMCFKASHQFVWQNHTVKRLVEFQGKKCIWLDCTLHVRFFVTVFGTMASVKWKQTAWHLRKIFWVLYTYISFFVVSIIIKKQQAFWTGKKHVDELD